MLIDVRTATKERGHVVPPEIAAMMLAPLGNDWGTGFEVWGQGTTRRYGHYGVQLGFLSEAWINQDSGDGVVIMTNGEAGLTLADDITRALADGLGWSEFQSRSLIKAVNASQLFLRGSMNDWSTRSPMIATGPNEWAVTLTLKPGDYSLKIATEDWKTAVLGGVDARPVVSAAEDVRLVAGGDDIAFRAASAGTYSFVLKAAETGNARLAIRRQ